MNSRLCQYELRVNHLLPYVAGAHKAGFKINAENKVAKLSGNGTDVDTNVKHVASNLSKLQKKVIHMTLRKHNLVR